MSFGSVATVPPPPPRSYKSRRGWLIVFGIFEILIGCLLLLVLGFTMYAVRTTPATSNAPASPAGALAVVAVFYGILAVFFVTVGIGSMHARRWARIAMLVFGWCWLVIGILSLLMMAVMMPMIMQNARSQSQTPMPAGTEGILRIVMLSVMAVFFVLLPLIFVLFYSGKNVKATCESALLARAREAGMTDPGKPAKPVSVIVLAVWFGFSAVSCLLCLPFFRNGIPLFGTVVSGWAAYAYLAVVGVLSAWLAWNLYLQRSLAWRVAVGWVIFGLLSLLVTQARMGFADMYRQMGYGEAEVARLVPFVSIAIYVSWAVAAAFLVFLVTIRKHFDQPALVPAVSP